VLVTFLLLCALALLSWALAAGAGADGPLTPGSFVQQGEKLVPAAEQGAGFFGRDAALSRDGSTAVVGAPRDSGEAGAAFVFTRSGSLWTQQAKLEVGKTEGSSFFGRGVALSADGSTALIGDPGNGSRVGAAWVFARSGTTWTEQARLAGTGEVGAGQFGRSVTLSGDGSTAIVGAFADATNTGAAWVFARSGSSWSQQGAKLTGGEESSPGWFGRSVALSGDGSTAAIGGNEDNHKAGALWVFTRSGSGWTQQGPKFTGAGEAGSGEMGAAVALSDDGSTALAGGPGDEGGVGAAWAFARSGSTWAPQGAKLLGGSEVGAGLFGYSLSLSGDGATALVGAYDDNAKVGGAWVFGRSGSAWAQQGSKLTGGGEVGPGLFGFGVALSGDGNTALVGGIGDAARTGAAWPFTRLVESEPPITEEHTTTTQPPPTRTGTTTQTPTITPQGSVGVLATTSVSSPVLGHTGNLQPVSGKVFVQLPGTTGFVQLSGLRQVPFGTTIDATAGRVLLNTATAHNGVETGEFFAGEFILTQRFNGIVTAALTGGDASLCKSTHRRAAGAHASARRGRTVRRLWANAHGTFTTKGSYAAGAVQGTEWLTEDRCDGTLIRVTRDKVKVTDLRRHRSVIVRAPHSVLIKAR
jgi:hypothetical protein